MRLILAALLTISAAPGYAGENCTCRYKEADVAEGQTICMQTPNGSQMATCARVLNNTSWKFSGQPCPTAQISEIENLTRFDPAKASGLLSKES